MKKYISSAKFYHGYGRGASITEVKITNELVFLQRKQALTTSLKVAEYFDKNHQHVMRDIRQISTEMDVSNFGQMFHKATYPDSYGRQQPMYTMNRDGFMFVVMGLDNADMVLTAGAFTSEEDTETASDVLFTLLCNLGLLKKEDKPSPIPLSVLLEQIGDTAAVYVKELVDKE